jgi:hypothetical protein
MQLVEEVFRNATICYDSNLKDSTASKGPYIIKHKDRIFKSFHDKGEAINFLLKKGIITETEIKKEDTD